MSSNLANSEEKERLKQQIIEDREARREQRNRRIRDIGLGALGGAAIALVAATWSGVLTTQSAVRQAREDVSEKLASLRVSVCTSRFEASASADEVMQRIHSLEPEAQRAELRRYIADRRLALMDSDTEVKPGIAEACAEEIRES